MVPWLGRLYLINENRRTHCEEENEIKAGEDL